MISHSIQARSPRGAFANEPFVDFKAPENARAMRAALDKVAAQLGREYDLVVGGRRLKTEDKIRSINPARPAQVVGVHQKAGAAQVEGVMAAALHAFESWSRVPAAEGALLLLGAAEIIRRRKLEFAAWLVYEVGKNWAEADADVGEAIDFLEFYAREALRLAAAVPPIQYPGERDELLYIPLGVGAVIPPWNFPLAILAGMTSAAIVAGNTVVLKPSSDAPTVAAKFVEALEEAGLPDGVVNFCPGAGASFGNAIVEHPKTRFIAFTGSKAVGLAIHERAARTQPGQIWIKRTILEMGGKDPIVVCADADLDAALDSMLRSIETGKREGRLIAGGSPRRPPAPAEDGFFLEPTVFADVAPDAAIAQEEIFGPVLAVIKAGSFEEGLRIANNSEYGLTGAIYSTDRGKLDRARREFHVGNLYFNRKCTGAMVGAHPFGGFNMSGTDSKAGGPDYLYLFTQAKSVAEKL